MEDCITEKGVDLRAPAKEENTLGRKTFATFSKETFPSVNFYLPDAAEEMELDCEKVKLLVFVVWPTAEGVLPH